ncbi:MucBP domain-containing protein [Levilactobacillus yiduensis]|uniref:MucBP domain-containing protein n=1 Tax=Levilactobacillus yiduensis TaxID=2953880 RepID=UPI0021570DB6|nr:MucBP domain-containing protein [Levilactobacillus yiduensis]
MFNLNDEKRHYKMYKKGKQWLLAGIVTATLTCGGVVTASAATETHDDDPASAESVGTREPDQVATLRNTAAPATKETAVQPVDEPADNVTEEAELPTEESGTLEADPVDDDQPGPATEPVNTAKPDEAEKLETPADSQRNQPAPQAPTLDRKEAVENDKKQVTPAPAVATPVAFTTGLAAVPAAPVVDNFIDQWLPNQTLQNEVLSELQQLGTQAANGRHWDSVADITQDDMALVTSLSVSGGGSFPDTYIDGKTPFSLKGLEYAVNLKRIHFSAAQNTSTMVFGDIVDISPLAGLRKLEYVDLSGNRISDITPLAGLTNIKELSLAYNGITDFSVLAGRQFDRLTTDWQYIILPTIRVNSQTRTADISQLYVNSDGQVVTWSSGNSFTMPYRMLSNGQNVKKLFYRGVTYDKNLNPRKNADGSLTFTGIYDQEPGPTTTSSSYTVEPQKNKYFLIGQLSRKDEATNASIVMAAIFQPYEIADEAATVTVHYQDEAGKTLRDDEVLPTGLVGDSYETHAQEITGYQLKVVPENATGLYGVDPIDVVYVYEKTAPVQPPVVTPVAEIKVTVHYQLADGTPVAGDTSFTGKTGEAYTTTPLDLSDQGWELIGTPANASGTLGEADIAVVYIYQAKDAPGEEGASGDELADDPVDMTNDDAVNESGMGADIAINRPRKQSRPQVTSVAKPARTRVQPAVKQLTQKQNESEQATLPQTDEAQLSSKVGWLALATLVAGLGAGLLRKWH